MKKLCILIIFFISLLSAKERKPYLPLYIDHIPVNDKVLFLTFDICPRKGKVQIDEPLLRFLMDEQIPATLFISGRWIEKNRETLTFLSTIPEFSLAGHGWFHENFIEAKNKGSAKIISETAQFITFLSSEYQYMFRPPFALPHTYSEWLDGAYQSASYLIHFTYTSADPASTLKEIFDRVMISEPGSILLFHLNGRGIHTLEALKTLIPFWRQNGYTFGNIKDYLKPSCSEH